MVTRLAASTALTRSILIHAVSALLCIALVGLPPTEARAQGEEIDEVPAVDSVDSDDMTDEIVGAGEDETPGEKTSGRGIETIKVTARKREDDLQDVPIPMTAFSGQTLEIQKIENTLDLQFNVPNLFFGKTNFTGSNLQIRGIGSAVVSSSGEPAIGIHVNEVPLTTSRIFEQEFYDIERIEVLRGPQGTLFGRNATGGAFNIYTRMPTDEYEADGEISAGNYGLARVKGAVNIPITESFRTRIAGTYLHRNGYIDNLETGNDIDDRNLYGIRGSIEWDVTDRFSIDGMVSWFDENDSRSRIGKQLCDKDTRPGVFSLGCTKDKPGTESLASYATLGGIFETYTIQLLTLGPLYTPGYTVGGPSNPADVSGVNPSDLRTHDARIDPSYNADELFTNLGFNLNQDYGSFKLLVGYQKTTINTVQDYNMGQPAIPWNGDVVTPAAVAGLSNCTLNGNTGIRIPDFGCVDRSFAQDNSDAESEQIGAELRFTSDFDGPFNFTTGAIYTYFTSRTDYKVFFSGAEIMARIWRNTTDPTYDVDNLRHFNNESKPARTKSFGLFAEGDYEFGESWTLTGGIRYTNDQKEVRSRNYLLDGFLTGSTSTIPDFQKQEAKWNEVTGRAIVRKDFDFDFADQSNAYLSYSRGYKPGGFNPPAAAAFPGTEETFAPEYINAFEVGSKNRFLDNTLQANLGVFFYDYQDYQISKIVNRTSVNENVDAFVWGAELELVYEVIENLFVSTNFAYLGTNIRGGESIDPADPADGNDNLVDGGYDVIKRLDNASNILCERETAGTPGCRTTAPNNPGSEPFPPTYEDANGDLLAGYVDGFAKDLAGNELPNAPKFNINIGAAYTFKFLIPGEITPRIGWYWQSDMYGRLFNSERDKIESWSQANAGLRWNDDSNRLYVDFWIQNFTNNDDITTHYFTDASSGNFTNVFLLEPLTVGGTIGFSF